VRRPVESPAPKPRENTELQQRKKFAYTKNEIDQEKEIEDEIQRELEISRIRRTDAAKEKAQRPVVYHHSRYIERPRYVEETNMGVYDRTATYDAVNRGSRQYQHIDDSYYMKDRPEAVTRVEERVYNPGVTEVDERRSRFTGARKSYVNPQYQAEMDAEMGHRKSGEGYVSREVNKGSPRMLEVPRSERVVTTHVQQNPDGSPRMVGTSGVRGEHRYAGTTADVDVGFRSEPGLREETKVIERVREERSAGRNQSPRSYSSNQRLNVRTGSSGAIGTGVQKTSVVGKTSAQKRNFAGYDSEDDDDSDY
jgi:hypothetical protein